MKGQTAERLDAEYMHVWTQKCYICLARLFTFLIIWRLESHIHLCQSDTYISVTIKYMRLYHSQTQVSRSPDNVKAAHCYHVIPFIPGSSWERHAWRIDVTDNKASILSATAYLPGTRPALSSPGLFIPPLKDITCLFLEFPALSINNRTLMICMPTYFFCVFVAFSKVYYVYLSICISFYSPIAVYVYMSISQSVYMSICLPVYLPIFLFVESL